MKAKNPHGPGFVDVTFSTGKLWTHTCKDCGWSNGGFIESAENTREAEDRDPYSPVNRPCLRCGSAQVEWEEIGTI